MFQHDDRVDRKVWREAGAKSRDDVGAKEAAHWCGEWTRACGATRRYRARSWQPPQCAQEEETGDQATNECGRIDKDAPILLANANEECHGHKQHRAESELNGEGTRGNEAALTLGEDAAKPGLHVGPCDRLRRRANAEPDRDQPDAGEGRQDTSGNRHHDGDIEDGPQQCSRADQQGEPSEVAAVSAKRCRHQPLQDAADEGEEADQRCKRWRCAERCDERDREAIAVQRDGDGVGDGEGAEGGVAAGEESPPVGDRFTHRP